MAFNVNGRDFQTEVCSQKLEVDLKGGGGGERAKTQNIHISFSPSGKNAPLSSLKISLEM